MVVSSSLRSGSNCRWGEWMYSALFTLNTTTEVPLSKAPNPQMAAHCSGCVCVCVHAVCVHLGWVKCRALIPSMGYHTWPHVTSKLHDHMYYYIQKWRNVLYRCRFIFNLSWVTLEAAWTIWHSPKTTTWNGGDFLKLYFTLSSSSLK